MNHFFVFLVSLLFTHSVIAQQQTTTSFTLDQCIEYALQNSIDIQNAKLGEQAAEAKVKETIGLGLPQIKVEGNLIHNVQLQRFFTTYTGTTGFLGDLSTVPNIQIGDVVAAQNFFQLKNIGTASISATQLLFNGSYIVGLQASKAYKELSYKTADQTKEQIIQQIKKAYYTVLINQERKILFSSNVVRLDSLLKNTTALYKNGFVESIDVDRIKVAFNNIKSEEQNFLNLYQLSVQLLKFQMNYPIEQDINLVGSIHDITVEVIDYRNQELDYKNHTDYKIFEANKKLQELNIKNQYATGLPTLVAFGSYGFNTQSDKFMGLFKTNSSIPDMSAIGPDKWYSNSQIGVSLSMPIFSGLQRHYKVQQEKLNLKKLENSFIQLKNGIDLQRSQAVASFENALNTLTVQKENIELASNVANLSKIKYQQGVGSNIELLDAETNLRAAQTNYYTALFDALVAKVDLDKVYGKLIPSSNSSNQ